MKNSILWLYGLIILTISCQSQPHSNLPSSDHRLLTTDPPNLPETDSVLRFNSRINTIFQDSKGHYWFISQDDGVCYYDEKKFTYYTEEQGLKPVRAIHEAPNGDLWFGIEEGVSIFNGQSFISLRPERESLPINMSFEYSEWNFEEEWEKQLNHFWFSSFNKNGVYRFDGDRLMHFSLPVPNDYPEFDDSGYHPQYGYDIYAVYGIYQDKRKNLWLGTAGSGLFRYNGKSITCVNQEEAKGVVRAIYQDDSRKIWFGNNAKGVFQYDGGSFANFSKKCGVFEQGLVGALAIAEDNEGNLWFAQYDTGLWRYSPSLGVGDKAWTQYTSASGLESNYISTLYTDRQGKLWVGTGKGAVFNFNGASFDKFGYK